MLNGNWAIVGTHGALSQIVLASLITVTGNTITADTSESLLCGGPPYNLAATTMTGTIAQNGTFQITTLPADGIQVVISGTAPATTGGSWTGQYSVVGTLSAGCKYNASGSFTAQAIPPLTGTYVGPADTSNLGKGAIFSMQLAQPASPTNISTEATYAVSGTIVVTNSPCFTSGTTSSVGQFGINSFEGDYLNLTFAMNDGSTLRVIGSLVDPTAQSIEFPLMTVSSGSCNSQGTSATLVYQ